MPVQPLVPPPPPQTPPGPFVRIEYLDFQSLAEHREFRLRVYGADGSTEFRFRIANAAFHAGRLRLQDGPEVCYQKLVRAVAAGEATSREVITIEDADLARYREAHIQVPKYRSWTPSATPTPPIVPRKKPRTASPVLSVAPLGTNDTAPALQEGQRVSHAVFGAGVTTASNGDRTVVCFDQDGPRTFVTSMLDLDVLSAPHTWETGPRGKNRPRQAPPLAADDVPGEVFVGPTAS
jgi:hypothetical protein